MSQIVECTLITETKKGTRIKSAATLAFVNGRIEFLKSPYSLKDEIKAMKGSKWHGYDDPPRKIWSVEDCPRNRFQLAYLRGENPYEWFDRDVIEFKYERPLMPHQRDLSNSGLTYHYQIWAAEMGCVDGDAIVHVNRNGTDFSLTLRELCYKQLGGEDSGGRWDLRVPTFIKGYTGEGLGLIRIKKVLFKGVRTVYRLITVAGRDLILTPDHEVCIDGFRAGKFCRLDELHVGDTILVAKGSAPFRPGVETKPENLSDVTTDMVAAIVPAGTKDVYDIVCQGPYHNFIANGIVVHNCGKTLSAIEVMEKSGISEWFYCGPKAALKAIEREFKKWKLDPRVNVTLLTYDALVKEMDQWPTDRKPPMGVIFDESSRLKTATSQRARAAQKLADLIRQHYGFDGYVILMSGTPSPKTPVDWWSQAEIAWPGFLKEGSPKALEARLAFMAQEQFDSGVFQKRIGWKDDERKCNVCGKLYEDGPHELDGITEEGDYHPFEKSKNEVSLMYERLKGLVVVKHKKDCLALPDKRYRTILCKPNKSILRVAQALVSSAPNAITGLTLLRELSDGFQYREEVDGMTACTHCNATGGVQEWFDPSDEERTFKAVDMLSPELVARLEKRTVCCPACGGDKEVPKYKRIVREIPCPKEAALLQLLDEVEENGRIVVAAGFTGSVDRCVNICLKHKWDVVRCDGRGFHVFRSNSDGSVDTLLDVDALDYWADRDNARVAFVMHPESGGMGLTLVEARMMVFWSNSFKPEYRIQAEDRIHRKGMDENLGCEIVDLIHLPTDQRVLDVIKENRKLELMTMGEIVETLKDESTVGSGELVEITE